MEKHIGKITTKWSKIMKLHWISFIGLPQGTLHITNPTTKFATYANNPTLQHLWNIDTKNVHLLNYCGRSSPPTNMRNHFRYYIANLLLTLSQSQQLSKFIAAIAAMEQKWKTDQPGPPLLEKDLKDWISQFSQHYNSKLPYK